MATLLLLVMVCSKANDEAARKRIPKTFVMFAFSKSAGANRLRSPCSEPTALDVDVVRC